MFCNIKISYSNAELERKKEEEVLKVECVRIPISQFRPILSLPV